MQALKTFFTTGAVFFVLTYLSFFIWLYYGVTNRYNFCLPPNDPMNLFGLLAGACGIITLMKYSNHERGNVRALGIITFAFGVGFELVVALRLVVGVPMC
jgi:hypothetical protein